MTETPRIYNVGDRQIRPQSQPSFDRPQSQPSFEAQLQTLPPDVRSVAESLALRDPESAKRYVAQYLSANRGVRS